MRRVRKLFSRPENVRDAAQRRNRLQRRPRIEPRRCPAGGGGTETAAGSNQSSGAGRNVSFSVKKTGEGRRLWNERCRSCRQASRAVERITGERWRHAFKRQAGARDRTWRRAKQSRDGK